MGWGTFNETDNTRTGGIWSVTEQSAHINILELKACLLGLKSFAKHISHTHMLACLWITQLVVPMSTNLGGKSRN